MNNCYSWPFCYYLSTQSSLCQSPSFYWSLWHGFCYSHPAAWSAHRLLATAVLHLQIVDVSFAGQCQHGTWWQTSFLQHHCQICFWWPSGEATREARECNFLLFLCLRGEVFQSALHQSSSSSCLAQSWKNQTSILRTESRNEKVEIHARVAATDCYLPSACPLPNPTKTMMRSDPILEQPTKRKRISS